MRCYEQIRVDVCYQNVDVNLIGDKGYIMNNTDKKVSKELKVTIITPKRKNQKEKNTESEKNKLKKRYKVENMFQKIKTYNRVLIRRDKLIATYMGFVYLACIIKFGKMYPILKY